LYLTYKIVAFLSFCSDEYDTAKCISSAGTHQSSDRPIRNPMDKRKDETVETATTPARQRPR